MAMAGQQQGNTILIALAGILGLIIISVLVLNQCSKQKIREMSTTNASTPSDAIAAPALTESSVNDSDSVSRNDAYANCISEYDSKEASFFKSWDSDYVRVRYEQAKGSDEKRMIDPLANMISAYAFINALDTPECKKNEKNRKMNIMADGIEELNSTENGDIVPFTRIETVDVPASDC